MEKDLIIFLSLSALVSKNCQALLLLQGTHPPRPREENACHFHKNKHKSIYLFLNLYSSNNISVYKYPSYKSKADITEIISTLTTEYQAITPT